MLYKQEKDQDSFKELYKELLKDLGPIELHVPKNSKDEKALTCAPGFIGECYGENANFRLMYVGRSVNGWGIAWNQEDDFATQALEAKLRRTDSENKEFDLNDVASNPGQVCVRFNKEGKEINGKYHYNRSPFFQLCKSLLTECGISKTWAENIAWTNLFKVAPYVAGNPGDKLKEYSLKACVAILKKEIELYEPTHIVFVTGWEWFKDFELKTKFKELPSEKDGRINDFINGFGTLDFSDINGKYKSAKVVICQRPEGRNGTRKEQGKAIKDAFNK